jgi:microcystin-dependent protein
VVDPFVAEIRMFGFNFPPLGWATCDGQLMPISQNTALFSLLGTFYGGNGQSTFALPDMQGAAPMFWGSGPGLSQHFGPGEQGGTEIVTLLESEMPAHAHTVFAATDPADVSTAGPTTSFARSNGNNVWRVPDGNLHTLAPEAVAPTGGDQPHNNLMPYLVLNFCIALQGTYPQRA